MKVKARAGASAAGGLWKAGVARSNITPTKALWLAGYASRTRPAEGKATDLWLKALALEDASGHRAVIVTSDLLAIRGSLYRTCLPRLKAEFGLEPSQILLTAAHTHCGPLLPNRPGSLSMLDEKDRALSEQYCGELGDRIIETASRALAELAPARLAAGQANAEFAANRRNNAESERPRLAQQGTLAGPVDHSVPVLAAYQSDGKLRAVLFGYTCHNTTTNALHEWCADYAGFAQAALEKSHPDATALFFIGRPSIALNHISDAEQQVPQPTSKRTMFSSCRRNRTPSALAAGLPTSITLAASFLRSGCSVQAEWPKLLNWRVRAAPEPAYTPFA
jgi:hypothetical protein